MQRWGHEQGGCSGEEGTESAAGCRFGGIGVFIGVALALYGQSMANSVNAANANPFLRSSSSGSLTAANAITAFGILFVLAGVYYGARGLLAQSRAQGGTQPQLPADPGQRPLVECPVCKEQIRHGAEKCRFCGSPITWP